MNSYETVNDVLVKLFNEIMDVEERALITSEYKDISVNDMHVIEAIGIREPKNMSTVARAVSVTVGTLTIAINHLVKKGYVERSRSEEDRRVVLVSLSEKGEKAYFHHRMFHEKMVMEILDGMDEKETEVLTGALTKLQKFFRNWKLHRADCQNLAVKFPDIEGAAGFFLLFLFQIKEVQITEIIFKIVTGSFNNILIDLTGDLCIPDSEDLRKS